MPLFWLHVWLDHQKLPKPFAQAEDQNIPIQNHKCNSNNQHYSHLLQDVQNPGIMHELHEGPQQIAPAVAAINQAQPLLHEMLQ